jgi:hypothetical protein
VLDPLIALLGTTEIARSHTHRIDGQAQIGVAVVGELHRNICLEAGAPTQSPDCWPSVCCFGYSDQKADDDMFMLLSPQYCETTLHLTWSPYSLWLLYML